MPDELSTDLAVREEREVARPLPPMNDAEVAAAYRTAQAFAQGGLFKDVKSAGEAFTKILAGRDLGLTPYESMSSLNVIEGKIEANANLHASKVRQREGYDFEVFWIKAAGEGDDPTAGAREVVAAEDDDPADLRADVGCAIKFTVDGKSRGVSRWTLEDSLRAGLTEPTRNGKKSNHLKFPRNMYYSRSMAQGVHWFVPEVMGGLRVYGLGELPRGGEDVTAATGGDEGADHIELPIPVEAVLARARSLGHMGIANRAAAEWAVRDRSEVEVAAWVRARTQDLNRFAAGKEEPVAEEPPDAEVVDPEVEVQREAALEGARANLAAHEAEREAAPPAGGYVDRTLDATANAFDALVDVAADEERREAMRRRANDLLSAADDLETVGDKAAADDARAEAEDLYEKAGPAPEQESFDL